MASLLAIMLIVSLFVSFLIIMNRLNKFTREKNYFARVTFEIDKADVAFSIPDSSILQLTDTQLSQVGARDKMVCQYCMRAVFMRPISPVASILFWLLAFNRWIIIYDKVFDGGGNLISNCVCAHEGCSGMKGKGTVTGIFVPVVCGILARIRPWALIHASLLHI